MSNIKEKHRLGVYVNTDTYNELTDFIRNNELVTSKLSKGTVITLALNMLFKTAEHRDISDLMMEYLQDQNIDLHIYDVNLKGQK